MRTNRQLFWWRWMMLASALVLLVGLLLVCLPGRALQALNLLYFGAAAGPATLSAEAVSYLTFVYAVLGSVMTGWGATLMCIVAGPFRRLAPEGWKMVAWSLLAWYVPDTVLSLWLGFWPNAVLNLVFAGLFGVPLVATYQSFFDTPLNDG